MRFNASIKVTGIKRSKGEMDGVKFDSTKIYVDTDLDDRSGNALGQATTEYAIGTSDEFEKFKGLTFPFTADATFNQVTTGKVSKLVIESIVPAKAKQ